MKEPFLVTYQDGSSEECNTHHVSKRKGWLQPHNTRLPAGVTIPPENEASLLSALSPAVAINTIQEWQLVQLCMPGDWPNTAPTAGWRSWATTAAPTLPAHSGC